jgi:hypothetical protein
MKGLALAVSAFLCLASAAAAEQPRAEKQPIAPQISLGGTLTPTPDMWFYGQAVREYSDPQLAVRRKAELASAQRQRRIAARDWFGVSNARPTANVTPLQSSYSQTWVSGTRNPLQWSSRGPTNVVLQPRVTGTTLW